MNKIIAIIVTYYPDVTEFFRTLDSILPQVEEVLIVDNTPWGNNENYLNASELPEAISVLRCGTNLGIAAAQNKGIIRAKEKGFSHALFFDQDSIPRKDMVEKLLIAESALVLEGKKIAAIGPQYTDLRYKQAFPFISIRGWKIKKTYCTTSDSQQYIKADYLISSGMLIRISTIEDIGEMDEKLFIDYVDIEWGLRARAKGYNCFGVCAAEMIHNLGDDAVRLFGSRRRVPIRHPLRHYYMFRNAIDIYRRPYIPFWWVINDAYRLLLKYVYYSLMTTPRLQHFKMMCLGIWHGIIGRKGVLK